jgi:hypothetical protein
LTNLLHGCNIYGMKRYKGRAELASRVVRISLADYTLLMELSRRNNISVAEALHLALEHRESEISIPPQQIPIASLRVSPRMSFVIDGATPRSSAFVIKPRGGTIQ